MQWSGRNLQLISLTSMICVSIETRAGSRQVRKASCALSNAVKYPKSNVSR
ncbi:hypothetical protein ABH945_007006 [Paraburkholderia sp. GAS333]